MTVQEYAPDYPMTRNEMLCAWASEWLNMLEGSPRNRVVREWMSRLFR
jgi:hypothetical protein